MPRPPAISLPRFAFVDIGIFLLLSGWWVCGDGGLLFSCVLIQRCGVLRLTSLALTPRPTLPTVCIAALQLYTNLNASLTRGALDSSQVFIGLSARRLVHTFRHRTLTLFKVVPGGVPVAHGRRPL